MRLPFGRLLFCLGVITCRETPAEQLRPSDNAADQHDNQFATDKGPSK